MTKYELLKQDAINEWSTGANEMVSDARDGSSPWISPDSILRPNNMSLWYKLKQAQPSYDGAKPMGYDEVMRQHLERVKQAEEEYKRRQQQGR